MSVDNTSHPGRPGSDELVPSRYALRVGEIDVLVVSDGVLSLPTAMLAHNANPAVLAAWLEDMFLPPEMLDWPLNVVVVRTGGRTILIDAGLGVDPDLPRAGRLAQRLEAAGIDLPSVTDVVLTHMHMDHVGGLLADGLRGRLRPDLRVHLAAAEAEFWASPDFSRTSMPSGFPPSGSWTSTAASCGRSRRSTRWRRGWSPIAPAATPPGTAWSAWRPAATG
jgi:glyoxylase-like metal-dependent hydrolase (beta-lactamase superfamily II)